MKHFISFIAIVIFVSCVEPPPTAFELLLDKIENNSIITSEDIKAVEDELEIEIKRLGINDIPLFIYMIEKSADVSLHSILDIWQLDANAYNNKNYYYHLLNSNNYDFINFIANRKIRRNSKTQQAIVLAINSLVKEGNAEYIVDWIISDSIKSPTDGVTPLIELIDGREYYLSNAAEALNEGSIRSEQLAMQILLLSNKEDSLKAAADFFADSIHDEKSPFVYALNKISMEKLDMLAPHLLNNSYKFDISNYRPNKYTVMDKMDLSKGHNKEMYIKLMYHFIESGWYYKQTGRGGYEWWREPYNWPGYSKPEVHLFTHQDRWNGFRVNRGVISSEKHLGIYLTATEVKEFTIDMVIHSYKVVDEQTIEVEALGAQDLFPFYKPIMYFKSTIPKNLIPESANQATRYSLRGELKGVYIPLYNDYPGLPELIFKDVSLEVTDRIVYESKAETLKSIEVDAAQLSLKDLFYQSIDSEYLYSQLPVFYEKSKDEFAAIVKDIYVDDYVDVFKKVSKKVSPIVLDLQIQNDDTLYQKTNLLWRLLNLGFTFPSETYTASNGKEYIQWRKPVELPDSLTSNYKYWVNGDTYKGFTVSSTISRQIINSETNDLAEAEYWLDQKIDLIGNDETIVIIPFEIDPITTGPWGGPEVELYYRLRFLDGIRPSGKRYVRVYNHINGTKHEDTLFDGAKGLLYGNLEKYTFNLFVHEGTDNEVAHFKNLKVLMLAKIKSAPESGRLENNEIVEVIGVSPHDSSMLRIKNKELEEFEIPFGNIELLGGGTSGISANYRNYFNL